MVVPVFRAVGSLYPFFAKSASKTAFLWQLSKEKPPTGASYTDTATIFPKKYFQAGGGSQQNEQTTWNGFLPFSCESSALYYIHSS